MNIKQNTMQLKLTQNQIDTIYFATKNFIKYTADVDQLNELTEQQKIDYRNELEIVNIFANL